MVNSGGCAILVRQFISFRLLEKEVNFEYIAIEEEGNGRVGRIVRKNIGKIAKNIVI